MSRHRRRAALPAIGLTLGAVLAVVGVGIVPVTSLASWTDAEFTTSGAGTLDCATGLATEAASTMVSGTALGGDLGDAARVSGVTATRTGSGSQAVPTTAQEVRAETAWSNPLRAEALQALQLDLTGLLQLPLDSTTGALAQYAEVPAGGEATVAATGLVTDQGSIAVDDAQPAQAPTTATLDLATLLSAAGLPDGSQLTGAALELGAVASAARLDGCTQQWTGGATARAATLRTASNPAMPSVERDYAVSSLRLRSTTPLVGPLSTTAASALGAVQSVVSGLSGSAAVRSGIASGVTALLAPLVGGLGLGAVRIDELAIAVDTAPVAAVLTAPIADSGGVLRLDLAAGTATVDLVALLGEPGADGSPTLNGSAPNTELLVNEAVLLRLAGALTSAVEDWMDAITAALTGVLLGAGATAGVSVDLSTLGLPVATITARVDASLGAMLAGTAVATASVSLGLVNGLCGALLTAALFCPVKTLLDSLVGGIVGGLVGGLGGTVAAVIRPLVLLDQSGGRYGAIVELGAVQQAAAALLPVVARLTAGLFGEHRLLSIVVNAQNGQPGAPSGPGWGALPDGRFDVAALRVTALGGAFSLDLARSSVRSSVIGASPSTA